MGKAEVLSARLAEASPDDLAPLNRYSVRKGETIATICAQAESEARRPGAGQLSPERTRLARRPAAVDHSARADACCWLQAIEPSREPTSRRRVTARYQARRTRHRGSTPLALTHRSRRRSAEPSGRAPGEERRDAVLDQRRNNTSGHGRRRQANKLPRQRHQGRAAADDQRAARRPGRPTESSPTRVAVSVVPAAAPRRESRTTVPGNLAKNRTGVAVAARSRSLAMVRACSPACAAAAVRGRGLPRRRRSGRVVRAPHFQHGGAARHHRPREPRPRARGDQELGLRLSAAPHHREPGAGRMSRKAGSSFDLPIALGLIATSGSVTRRADRRHARCSANSRSTAGSTASAGVLPIAVAARRLGTLAPSCCRRRTLARRAS